MSSYTNQDDFAIRFRNVNQYENNLFIDNINLWDNNTSINQDFHNSKKLVKVIDVLGRKTSTKSNKVLMYIYDDNSVEKKIILK